MEKIIRHALSIIIKNNKGETLFAFRSPNKNSYPSTWSLPSHFVGEDEKFEDTVKRIGKNKLGVSTEAIKLINEGKSDRGNFILFMHDYEVKIIEGEPHIVSDDYTELKWSEPNLQLASIKTMGDCCRLYKEYLGKSK